MPVGIKNLNITKLYNDGIHRLGIIFNTDVSTGRGLHWISMFIDLKEKKIYFFDSVGKQPDLRIVALVDRIAKWILKKHYKINMNADHPYMRINNKNNIEQTNKLDIRFNTIQHQKENSECGVYSMHFILAMLQGITFDKYNSKRISDKEMNMFRYKFFTVRK
jgi:Ulp1 family protease